MMQSMIGISRRGLTVAMLFSGVLFIVLADSLSVDAYVQRR